MKINWQVLWEAVKEPLRLLVLGVIAFAIAELSNLPKTETISVVLLVLRFIDKLLYEYGKETGDDNIAKGLTRF